MTSAKKSWWYAIGQNKFGPCSSSELLKLVEQGKLFPDSLVWKEGMAKWVPASRIKGLWQKLPSTPPLLAGQAPESAPAQVQFGLPDPAPQSAQADSTAKFDNFVPLQSAWPDEEEYEEEVAQPEPVTFKEAIVRCFKKYVVFSGRASRAEYWYFILFIYGSAFLLGLLMGLIGVSESGSDSMAGILQLAVFLPSIAVATRRLHDTGRSGWWQLIVLTGIGFFVLLYWLIKAGDEGENEYGYPE